MAMGAVSTASTTSSWRAMLQIWEASQNGNLWLNSLQACKAARCYLHAMDDLRTNLHLKCHESQSQGPPSSPVQHHADAPHV